MNHTSDDKTFDDNGSSSKIGDWFWSDDARNSGAALPPPFIPTAIVSSSTTATNHPPRSSTRLFDGVVPDSCVSSSSATNSARKRDFYKRDGKRRSECRERKTGDWYGLSEEKDVKEQRVTEDGDIDAEEEQETAVPPETPSAEPIHAHPCPKQARNSSCRQAKREAVTAISSAVGDEDSGEDYEGESSAENCEEYYKQSSKRSNSAEIQGPKKKRARKGSHQGTIDKQWDAMFQLLLEYKAQQGNTLVPTKYAKNPQLGYWVQTQRTRHFNDALLSSCVLRLESIGFVWCVQRLREDANWESMFESLLEYKAQNGNTLVPTNYAKNPQLGHWVRTQRTGHVDKTLSSNRALRLESIGFLWSAQEAKWESMFQLLKEYKAQHGNTLVPRNYDANVQLGYWVQAQRRKYVQNIMLSNRSLRLESIGFIWCAREFNKEAKWESMFELLLEYKAQHGNTLVPRKYDTNPQLGLWVQTQRREYFKNKMLSNCVLRLESIGFVWCPKGNLLSMLNGNQCLNRF